MARIPFDYSLAYEQLDLRANPHLYRVGKGEQGVLLVQPYKSELLPLWRFRDAAVARQSAQQLMAAYTRYKEAGDFVGMDMTRKFLQMGYTRARRYANHKGGRKYEGPVPEEQKGRSGAHGRPELPRQHDAVKAAAATVFYHCWQEVLADPGYRSMQQAHIERYETKEAVNSKEAL